MKKKIVIGALALAVACAGIENMYAGHLGEDGSGKGTEKPKPSSRGRTRFDAELPDLGPIIFEDAHGHEDAEREAALITAAVVGGDAPVCGQHGRSCSLVERIMRLFHLGFDEAGSLQGY